MSVPVMPNGGSVNVPVELGDGSVRVLGHRESAQEWAEIVLEVTGEDGSCVKLRADERDLPGLVGALRLVSAFFGVEVP